MIGAEQDCVIAQVHVKLGDVVEAKDLLIEWI
jgi:biotin carboxyl carrier protein